VFTALFLNVDQNGERFMICITLPCTLHRLETKMFQMMTKSSVTKAENDATIITGQKRKIKGVCNRCGNQGHKSSALKIESFIMLKIHK
jgi:hypothetical protein